jgi:hypothetical protein
MTVNPTLDMATLSIGAYLWFGMPQAANRKIDVRNIDKLEREDILRKLTYIHDYLQNQ